MDEIDEGLKPLAGVRAADQQGKWGGVKERKAVSRQESLQGGVKGFHLKELQLEMCVCLCAWRSVRTSQKPSPQVMPHSQCIWHGSA